MIPIPAEIIDGVVVSMIQAVGRKLVAPSMPRRTAKELDLVRWFDTEALTRGGLGGDSLELAMPKEDAAELRTVLVSDEVQGAVQVLLCARLTDAPEADA